MQDEEHKKGAVMARDCKEHNQLEFLIFTAGNPPEGQQ
jgi:hypothetical protein